MNLLVLTGLNHTAKTALTQRLIQHMNTNGRSCVLLDNGDPPYLPPLIRQRITGGCICCSLADRLFPTLWRLSTEYAILLTSSSADPEMLSRLLDGLRGTHIHVTTIALVDENTENRFPYLAQKLAFYADATLYEPFEFEETLSYAVL